MSRSRATVLVVEDDNSLNEALSDTLVSAGYSVESAGDGREALRFLDKKNVDLVISDIHMPNMEGTSLLNRMKQDKPEVPVMLMTAYGTIQQAVETMRNGAVDYLVKPFEAEVLVNMVERYIGHADLNEDDIVAVSEKSKRVFDIAKRVAPNDATVMITGQSGTGKEVVAQYIHKHSNRASQPFIAINCAAIPENMLEATLFGYEKGAYTGAYKSSPGKFEQAQGGTLLLDEISEMDLGLQAKILRVLQEREVERLGGNKMISLDVRILATSNRNMLEEVRNGRFREDLYYRLNVFPLHLSSLQDRKDDIIPLAKRIIANSAKATGSAIPDISKAACNKLLEYSWQGNVRELDNVMQRATILHKNNIITENDIYFPQELETVAETEPNNKNVPGEENMHCDTGEVNNVSEISSTVKPTETLTGDLRYHEWDLIIKAIKETNGNRKDTAERLGISQRTLRYKLARMRKDGMEIPDAASIK